MEKPKLRLANVWKARSQLYAEANKLRGEGRKIYAEADKIWAKGDKLRAEGNKLRAEGDKLWADAILETYGNIKIEWKNWDIEKQDNECHLGTGEVFKP